MSPIDDQLRSALHARADVLPPSPDPLVGVEARARRLRRRRVAASVAGAALAVAAAGIAVPALLPGPATSTLTPATTPSATQTAAPVETQPPGNVLTSWQDRGVSTRGPRVSDLMSAFAAAMGRSADVGQVRYRELFLGDTGKGEGFTVGQAWFAGDGQAYDVSYTINTAHGSVFFLGKPTPADPVVLAFSVPNLEGMSDLLVVVPQPGTGQVSYDDGSGAFRPITGQDTRDGVVLVDRSIHATNDRLQLLNGDGDTAHPTFEGQVAPLLCGLKDCG